MEDRVLYQGCPAPFLGHPGMVIVAIPLCLLGIGFLILGLLWLQSRGERLTVTEERVIHRRGILSRHIIDVRLADIRNIRVSQGMFQRLFGVGALGVATAGTGGEEIAMDGIAWPEKVKAIIEGQRRRLRGGVSGRD